MVRLVSIPALARQLRPGETVFLPGSSGESVELMELLERDSTVARGVALIATLIPGINLRNPAPAGSDRRMRVFFLPANLWDSRRQRHIEFCPWAYSAIQCHLAALSTPIDTLVVQVGPPGRDGQCPLGPAVEFLPGLLRRNPRLLAVVNPNVPDLPGSMRISMDAFECYAKSDRPLAEYDAGPTNETSERIAQHLLGLIPSGATLQIGLGKVPSRLLVGLATRRDLAFHSGMLSDSVLDIAATGALRSEGALTTTVAVGSAHFYRQLAMLDGLRIAGVEHTHDTAVLSRVSRLHAINGALEVDLLGQVNSEALGGRYVSGPGGLPDFAHAARRSAGGLSIIALNSTDATGRHSRIVTGFAPGTPVTVPQHDVDAVVTEWGVARLRDCDVDERARRLIAVAHPDHREALRAHANRSDMVCYHTI